MVNHGGEFGTTETVEWTGCTDSPEMLPVLAEKKSTVTVGGKSEP